MTDGLFRVALTFDAEHPDRPAEPDTHDRIVDTLERLQVRASFFVQGRWVEAHPHWARSLPRRGHLVGSHSFYHARMPLLSEYGVRNDVGRAERVIRDTVGVDPRPWFRLPFGSGGDDPSLLAQLSPLGYRHVAWDVDARDWRTDVTARRLDDEIVSGTIERGDGAIVLMHSGPGRPWPSSTG